MALVFTKAFFYAESYKTDEDDPEEDDKGLDPNAGPAQWRSDRKIWYEHAFSAYDAADKLRPPGVDIPFATDSCTCGRRASILRSRMK